MYNAPVLSSIERDPSVTALYLFPTKALAQDQLRSLKGLVHSSPALRQRVQCWWVLCGAWDCHDTPTLAHLCSCVCVCVCVCVRVCVPLCLTTSAYDGDTPHPVRNSIRDAANIVLTNPDMLHLALLPRHGEWVRFLGSLRWLVIDEAHT